MYILTIINLKMKLFVSVSVKAFVFNAIEMFLKFQQQSIVWPFCCHIIFLLCGLKKTCMKCSICH